MRICAYARVSTDKEEQTSSYEAQKSFFEREIKNKEGAQFCGIYADQGISGTKLYKRPEFNQMLYDAGLDYEKKGRLEDFVLSDRKPLFDYIYFKNTSRFARNILSSKIIELLRKKGVYLYFVEQNIDTKNLTQDFMLGLFQLFDQQDSKDKSVKTRTGFKEAIRQNKIFTNTRIYGYNYDKINRKLEIIKEEAEIIKEIFNLYSQGKGIRLIYNHLKNKGIKTRNGKEFGKTTLRNILIQEKYCGYNNAGKYDSGVVFAKNTYSKIKENYSVQKNEDIPIIIPEELFFKCKSIMEGKSVDLKGIHRGHTTYAGLIVCEKCGKNYISNRDVDRHFYNCATKKKYGVSACNNVNISLKTIENEIESFCQGKYDTVIELSIVANKKLVNDSIDRFNKCLETDTVKIVDNKLNEISKIDSKLDRLLSLYEDAEIDKDKYLERRNKLLLDRESIENEIKSVGNVPLAIKKYIEECTNILNIIDKRPKVITHTKEEIGQIVVDKEGKLFIIPKVAVDLINIAKKYFELSYCILKNLEENKSMCGICLTI